MTAHWSEFGNIIRVLFPSFLVEPAPSPQVTPVNTFLSNSLVTDLEGLSLSDSVLSPAVSVSYYLLVDIFILC